MDIGADKGTGGANIHDGSYRRKTDDDAIISCTRKVREFFKCGRGGDFIRYKTAFIFGGVRPDALAMAAKTPFVPLELALEWAITLSFTRSSPPGLPFVPRLSFCPTLLSDCRKHAAFSTV